MTSARAPAPPLDREHTKWRQTCDRHPDAYRKSVAIWCAPDQAEALGRALMSKPVMGEVGACSHPIDENIKLGKRLGVNSTPMVFLPNGQSFAGYRPASEVLALLQIEAQQK